jgi:integrase
MKPRRGYLYRRRGRWYSDFRAFAAVGGRQEGMIAPGESRATTDRAIAEALHDARLQQLKDARRNRVLVGHTSVGLGTYAARHLVAMAESGKAGAAWLAVLQNIYERAGAFLGIERPLEHIRPRDVAAWIAHLREHGVPGPREGTITRLSETSLRHHLYALSHLYERAQGDEVVPAGYNPARLVRDKPKVATVEATWWEVPEAALLLEAARTLRPVPGSRHDASYGYPLLATLLLTGGREAEVLGLEVTDISFDRQTVTFRPNTWRRLKTKRSARTVPLWPQLAEILGPYLVPPDRTPRTGLVFPGETGGLRTDVRKLWSRIAVRAGFPAGALRSKQCRHTYTASRLQTLDRGAPVALYTVSRELGHSSTDMVEKVYSHLGTVRHRSDVVEYRVEQHRERLAHRLAALTAQDRDAVETGPGL